MTSRARHLTILFSLVAVLLAAALPSLAQASPDGDDDPTYNAGSAFGTRYSSLDLGQNNYLARAKPVTDQDAADGSSVTATLIAEPTKGPTSYYLRLTRFDVNGLPSGFQTTEVDLPFGENGNDYSELLDLRVLADRSFVVLIRGYTDEDSGNQTLFLRHYDVDGGDITADGREYRLPSACVPILTRGQNVSQTVGYIKAARVTPSGGAFGLWDCAYERTSSDDRSTRGLGGAVFGTYVTRYAAGEASGLSVNSVKLTDVDFGLDLEFGPTGDPYALTGTYTRGGRLAAYRGTSTVFHVKADDLSIVNRSTDVPGLPVDLAVDSQARPVVWTEAADVPSRGSSATWHIFRLTAPSMSAIDTSWGSDGESVVSDPRLGNAYSPTDSDEDRREFLTVRPGDKVLASGLQQTSKNRSAGEFGNGIIAGLTSDGQTDTGFATNGFKPFEFTDPGYFDRIGEATLQSDGKVLIPHNTIRETPPPPRIANPPADDVFVGVTRLVGPGVPGNVAVLPSTPVRPSATPAICGRRAISLVRADVKGNKVKLTGLVGAALYGKKVTIQTDPRGARNSKFTKTGTVTASRTTGAFSATVPKPKASDFISIRYRAVSGSAKSPSLKLPQRLTSRSVKSATNTITVKGKVKKSVLGKRNKVLIRRLVCGRYRTVGTARPDKNGNYTVTFPSTQIRGVAFYRAESMVLRKPGSKKYVIQYARAIAIRTTSQTG